jgi:potassium-transporting ATPase potassium-binding subunit
MVAIKQLGTNGGGYFGPNSTHPLENPGFFSAVVENMAIVLIPMACVWMFGRLVGRLKHAAMVFAVMALLLLGLAVPALLLEGSASSTCSCTSWSQSSSPD